MIIVLYYTNPLPNVKLRHVISELSRIQILKFKDDIVGIFKQILTDIMLVVKSMINFSVTTN